MAMVTSLALLAQQNELVTTSKKLEVAKEDFTKTWSHSGLYNFALSQTSLTNWAAGGNNNTNVNFLIRQLAVMTKEQWVWYNLFEANLGFNFQNQGTLKTADKLEFTSRLDYKLRDPNWRLSLFGNFRSQFADGYTNLEDTVRISTFMAPAFITYGLGVSNNSIKGLNVYASPIQVRNTLVLDDVLFLNSKFFDLNASNVVRNTRGGTRWEMGAFVDIIYNNALTETFTLNSRLNLFTNYLDRPQNIDVNWETILVWKAYKNITFSLQLHLIYDHDINVRFRGNEPTSDGVFNAPGTQFMQVFGVGIGYAFGSFKK